MGTKGTIQIGGIAVNKLEQFSMNEKILKSTKMMLMDLVIIILRDVVENLMRKKNFQLTFKNVKNSEAFT